jgi:hypothetical protein
MRGASGRWAPAKFAARGKMLIFALEYKSEIESQKRRLG